MPDWPDHAIYDVYSFSRHSPEPCGRSAPRPHEIANGEIEADEHHERDKPLIALGRAVRDDKHAAVVDVRRASGKGAQISDPARSPPISKDLPSVVVSRSEEQPAEEATVCPPAAFVASIQEEKEVPKLAAVSATDGGSESGGDAVSPVVSAVHRQSAFEPLQCAMR